MRPIFCKIEAFHFTFMFLRDKLIVKFLIERKKRKMNVKNGLKKSFAVLLAVVMVLCAAPAAGFVGLDLSGVVDWFSTTAQAAEYTEGKLTYTVSDGKAEITDCDKSISGSFNIPSTLGGYSVTSIGSFAFSGCTDLTSVTIGNSVTSIGYSAFYGCTGLTKIIIPSSVKEIDDNAFDICSKLIRISVDPDNMVYHSQNNCLIDIKEKKLIRGCKNSIIPSDGSVTSISYAFSGCTGLTSITIPDSVTSIDDYAFWGCTGLTSITIPNSVTSIGSKAFSGCTGLISVTIPDSVTSIGSYAFSGCKSLTSVTIPDSVTSIGDYAFYGCTGLTSITISNSVTSIGYGTFRDCTGLTSVIILESVENIGSYAFGYYYSYGYIKKIDGFTIYGYAGTEAEVYAVDNDFPFVALSSHEHSYVETVTKAATCTEAGLKTFTCECGDSYTETIPAVGHKEVVLVGKPATCTETGLTDGKKCSVCGAVLEEQKVIPATGHDFETQTTPATCTSIGVETRTCKNCGESHFVKTLPATGHTVSEWIIDSEADCKNVGSRHKECTVCKTVLEKETIPMTSHNFVSNTVEPTCISLGYETKTCQNCGECQFVRAIPATGHTKTIVKGKEATCTESGLTEGVKCSVCGTVLEEQKVIPANGHKEVVIKGEEATCTESGLTEGKKCAVCSTVLEEQKVIPAKGHKEGIIPGRAPTCMESGLSEGKKCTVCGTITVKQEKIQALGHDWEPINKAPTCTKKGAIGGKKCKVCGLVGAEDTEIAPLGHDFVIDVESKDPTCTESGTTEGKHCTRCDYKVEAEEIEPLGHTDDDNDGKCDTCGDTIYIPIENCKCACHKKGIAKLFFKICLIFQKIFKKNRICKCGVWHY